MIKILNLGCGNFPLKDKKNYTYVNMDQLKLTNKQVEGTVYVRANMLKFPWPFTAGEFDRVYLSHVIEHIAEDYHDSVFRELWRITRLDGLIQFIYPEFPTIAQNYLNNTGGKRDYWKQCIYGRSGKGGYDGHKSLIDTKFFGDSLMLRGIEPIKCFNDKEESYNTVLVCKRSEPTKTYEQLLTDEVTSRRAF